MEQDTQQEQNGVDGAGGTVQLPLMAAPSAPSMPTKAVLSGCDWREVGHRLAEGFGSSEDPAHYTFVPNERVYENMGPFQTMGRVSHRPVVLGADPQNIPPINWTPTQTEVWAPLPVEVVQLKHRLKEGGLTPEEGFLVGDFLGHLFLAHQMVLQQLGKVEALVLGHVARVRGLQLPSVPVLAPLVAPEPEAPVEPARVAHRTRAFEKMIDQRLEALESATDEELAAALGLSQKQVRDSLKGLAGKGYARREDNADDVAAKRQRWFYVA